MSERLAIKTDQVDAWRKAKLGPAVKNLTPRESDGGLKSSWAHCTENGELSGILEDPAKATCQLQALALFFFSELHTRANRNRVTGVSLVREVIREGAVIEDPSRHPIPAYSVTHRSLALIDEEERQITVARIFAEKAFEDWEYTRDEMAELLDELLAAGAIDPAMEHDARSLLLQWTS